MHLEITSPGQLETKSMHGTNEKLTVIPQFFGNGRVANALLVKTFDGANNVLHSYLVEVSGSTGRLILVDRTAPVPAHIDLPKKPVEVKPVVLAGKK